MEIQIYGKHLNNSRIKGDVEIHPVTTAEAVKTSDGKTLADYISDIVELKAELEAMKKTSKKKSE